MTARDLADRLAALEQRLRDQPSIARAKGEAFADTWPGDHKLLKRADVVAIGERTYLVAGYTEIANELRALELLAAPRKRRRST